MADMTIDEFLTAIRKSQLLDAQQLETVVAQTSQGTHDARPKSIARRLVKDGTLTPWQAEMLLLGQTGFILDRYKVLEPVGRGGMGTVFRAVDRTLGRIVAVKVMAKRYNDDKTLIARFQREIQAAASVSSPHVVGAIDAGRVARTWFLVMEYVEGEDIDVIADRLGQLPVATSCEIIRQAALGLQAAHERGLVHRDIKPSNLMLTWDENDRPLVKIFDMGLVRLSQDDSESDMTRPGQVMGTPDYMSPEQGWNTADVDIRADIYSLGCTMFRLISGRVPFPGDNPLQVLLARCSSDAPSVRKINSSVSPEVDAVLLRIMARSPDDRYQTPADVAAALQPFCRVPTRQTFLTRGGSSEPADKGQSTSVANADQATRTELTYQRFLKDLRSSEQASLVSTGNDVFAISGETPSVQIPHALGTPSPSVSASRKRSKPTGSTAKWIGAGIGVISALILGAIMFQPDPQPNDPDVATQTGQGGDSNKRTPDDAEPASPPEDADHWLADDSREFTLLAGQTLAFSARSLDAVIATDDVRYSLDPGAPPGATIDAATGRFVWQPSVDHPGGQFRFRIVATSPRHRHSESMLVAAVIEPSMDTAKLNAIPRQTAAAGQAIAVPLTVMGQESIPERLSVRIGEPAPAGARINPDTWSLEWMPDTNTVGVHTVTIELVDAASQRVIDHTALEIVVAPKMDLPVLAAIKPQSIDAGSMLIVPVVTQDDGKIPTGGTFELQAGSATGAKIDRQTGIVTWTPTKDTKGTYEFVVRLTGPESAGLTPRTVAFPVTVSPADSSAVTTVPIPNEDEVVAAENEIREILKRDIAQARTTAARQQLAAKLLIRARQHKPLQTPSGYALLRMARDYAIRSFAWGTAIECSELMVGNFEQDSIDLIRECLESFRIKNAGAVDLLLVEEAALRFAHAAVEQDRFDHAETLLDIAETTARQSKNVVLIEDLKRISELLQTLIRPDGNQAAALQRDESALARTELLDGLGRWVFQPMFVSANSLNFLNHSNRELPDKGQSLWQVEHGDVTIDTPNQEALTGFLDRSKQFDRFTFRAKISAESTTGMMYFAAPVVGTFNGFQLQLSPQDFCQIKRNGTGQVVARPFGTFQRSPDGWDHIELAVDGPLIAVALNGVRVLETRVNETTSGYIGLDAFLGYGKPNARLQLFNARIR